ncbi:hypothetical protein Ancab_029197 [Ancistrocladus abbreviatus]
MMGMKKYSWSSSMSSGAMVVVYFVSLFNVAASNRRSLLDNNLGLTPPMGWNSWNHFRCGVNEDLVKQTADALVSTGLAKLGYNYVNLDDCWGLSLRDSQGNLVPDPAKFPSGMAALADYVHSLGLKFGIYGCAGSRTCSGTMPGSLEHEQQDANLFASWGIDYLKYDNCFNFDINPKIRYQKMSDALNNTGRPIFYNICEWMLYIADINEFFAEYAKPGAWNDPDMLEVGNGGMSFDQYKVHYSLWAISKAPLLIGCDICNMSNDTFTILANEEVIAVNQDSLGVQAKKVRDFGEQDVWAGPLSGNRTAVLLVNRKAMEVRIDVLWPDVGLPENAVVEVRDLWEHETLNTTFQGIMINHLTGFTCKMFVFTPLST